MDNNGFIRSDCVRAVKLHKPMIFKGVSYSPRNHDDDVDLIFHANGNVQFGILTKDTKFYGVTYKALTSITRHENGVILSGVPAFDQKIQGFKVKGNGYVSFDIHTNLITATLSCDQKVRSKEYKAGYQLIRKVND